MRKIDNWFGLTSVSEGADVVVLGCPFDGAASGRRGAATAPAALRRWSCSAEGITETGRPLDSLRIADRGDVADRADWHGSAVAAARAALARNPGAFLLGLGGDHAISQPLLQAVSEGHPTLGLLMFDAHADLFEEYDGDRHSHACTVARAWDESAVEPAATALIGLRSFASQELPAIRRAGLTVTARQWHRDGPDAVAARIISTLKGRPVYVSMDIDVLDPAHAPGTGYPVAGGPNPRALLEVLERVWPALDVVAADLVEVSPPLDPSEVTVACAAHLLLQVLGQVEQSRS